MQKGTIVLGLGNGADPLDLPKSKLEALVKSTIWRDAHFAGKSFIQIAQEHQCSRSYVMQLIDQSMDIRDALQPHSLILEIRDTAGALRRHLRQKCPFLTVSGLSLKSDRENPRQFRGFGGYVSGIVKNCKKVVEGEGFEPSNS